MSVATALERTAQISIWLHAQCDGAEWACTGDQKKATLALLQNTLDLVDAIAVLINNRLPGPALTLGRALFESYVRSYWLGRIASDEEFARMVKGKGPEFRDIMATLGDDAESGAAWIQNNKAANWKSFNGLIHGGVEHILRRLTESSEEPMYPEDELERFLGLAREVAIRAGVEIFALANDEEKMIALHDEVQRLER